MSIVLGWGETSILNQYVVKTPHAYEPALNTTVRFTEGLIEGSNTWHEGMVQADYPQSNDFGESKLMVIVLPFPSPIVSSTACA
jgi:hypothetical protein